MLYYSKLLPKRREEYFRMGFANIFPDFNHSKLVIMLVENLSK